MPDSQPPVEWVPQPPDDVSLPSHLVTLTRIEFDKMRFRSADYVRLEAKLAQAQMIKVSEATAKKREPVIICAEDWFSDMESEMCGSTPEIMGHIIRKNLRGIMDTILERGLIHIEVERVPEESRTRVKVSLGIISNLGDI